MEPAGLAIGVAAIAGLFNNAVDCFGYVQLGRNLEKDLATCVLKLGDARLGLSRWGQAVGLSGDLGNTEELHPIFRAEETNKNAQERLGHILKLFADAENISHKFQSGNKSNKKALQLYSLSGDLDPEIDSIRDKLRALSVKRQNDTSLKHKAKWALYEEKHFRKLIEDISSTIDGLIGLVPSAVPLQRRLCDQEAADLVTQETRQILRDIAAEQDKFLETAIARTVGGQLHMVNNWRNSDNTRIATQVASQTIYGGQTFNL
ncbi:hypothetical protein KCV07_g10133, partial [Aureobasidium melanogenum]